MTSHDDPRWTRVNELLDAGRDPFADPIVLDDCGADPAFAAELLRLVERMTVLRVPTPRLRARRRAAALVAAMLVAAMLVETALVVVDLCDGGEAERRDAIAHAGKVLSWSSVVRRSEGGVVTSARLVAQDGAIPKIEYELEATPREGAAGDARVLACRIRMRIP